MPGADVVAGRFALCDPLARGAAGTVWRAWDLRRGDWCAAKVMRQRDAGDLLRFAREQQVRLEHPHLLTPYSWAAEDAHVVLASRLVGGGSLHTLLGDHGPLAPALVADLLDQLLSGLAHAHAAGVVHRDVTLANVLLEATGAGRPVALLADFGLAVRVGEPRLTRLGTVLGTAGYVPPEVLAGAAPHPSADLYAAGRLAEALLTGTEPDPRPPTGAPDDPRPGGTPGEGPGAVLGGRPGAVLGERLSQVLAALTVPDPADRPTAAEARRMLAAAPAVAPSNADGDPVTVPSQLPPLPPDWTPPTRTDAPDPTGPAPLPPSARRTETLVGPGPSPTGTAPLHQAPRPATPPDRMPPTSAASAIPPGPAPPNRTPPTSAGTAPAVRPGAAPPDRPPSAAAAPQVRPVTSPPHRTPRSASPARPGTAPPDRTPPAPAGPAPGRRRWVVGGGAAVLVGAAAVAVVLGTGDRGGGPGGGTPSPSPSGVPVVTGPATAGGTCGWQQEGDGATDPTGRALLCVRTGDGYRWQLS